MSWSPCIGISEKILNDAAAAARDHILRIIVSEAQRLVSIASAQPNRESDLHPSESKTPSLSYNITLVPFSKGWTVAPIRGLKGGIKGKEEGRRKEKRRNSGREKPQPVQ